MTKVASNAGFLIATGIPVTQNFPTSRFSRHPLLNLQDRGVELTCGVCLTCLIYGHYAHCSGNSKFWGKIGNCAVGPPSAELVGVECTCRGSYIRRTGLNLFLKL